ncbi:MAG: hypothetical protein ACRD4Y_18340 [Candidatus Acidiferrales bacterium]
MRTTVLLLSAILAAGAVSARAQEETADAALAMPSEASAPRAQRPSWAGSTGRMFFPHHWLRGYVGFDVAPPYNEPDLGRCSQSQQLIAQAGGANSPCTAYARYLLSGYLEIQPFGRTLLRHLFVFYQPTFSFGNNVPQYKYTASMAGIAYERAVGVGYELPWNFEIRATQHQVDWLGKFKNNVGGPAGLDLGTAGPYGLYATIGARWYFGGYGRSHDEQ